MNKLARWLTMAALAAALLFVIVLLANQPGPSDDQIIAQQVNDATAAAARGDTGGVMKIVSNDYHDPAIGGPARLRLVLEQSFNHVSGLAVRTQVTQLTVHESTAESALHVIASSGAETLFDRDVTLHWKRVGTHRWLVFPAHTWQVTGAEYGGAGDLGGFGD